MWGEQDFESYSSELRKHQYPDTIESLARRNLIKIFGFESMVSSSQFNIEAQKYNVNENQSFFIFISLSFSMTKNISGKRERRGKKGPLHCF